MGDFIITAIIIALTVGVFFGLMFTSSMQGFRRCIATIVIALIIGMIISVLIVGQAHGDIERWNNGVCPNCGEPWRLVSVQHLRSGDTACYYTCDKCQRTIELHGLPN